MSDDPVSWFLIERGWRVVDSGGQEIGSVDEIVGDSSDDIFNGLAISTSLLGRPRYVPSEQVGLIIDGRVQLRISNEEAERLGEFEEPPTTAQILPESASAVRRADASIEAPIHSHVERVNFLTRVRDAFRRLVRR
jgi:hypothetical protein